MTRAIVAALAEPAANASPAAVTTPSSIFLITFPLWSGRASRPQACEGSSPDGAPLRRGVGAPVLMHEPPIGIGTHHVDIGASSEIVRVPRAHLEIDGH